jgi:hypothetical protein
LQTTCCEVAVTGVITYANTPNFFILVNILADAHLIDSFSEYSRTPQYLIPGPESYYELLKYILIGLVLILTVDAIVMLVSTPANAQVSYTHRRIFDNVEGNKVGWNPDGQKKAFGIADSKFNPNTSIVLINTWNPISPGVVCHVDHRGYGSTGPGFEVNCGAGNPSAVAPLDGIFLDYLIITMPFSPPDTDIFEPGGGGVISLRNNMTQSAPMENQTQQTDSGPGGTLNPN